MSSQGTLQSIAKSKQIGGGQSAAATLRKAAENYDKAWAIKLSELNQKLDSERAKKDDKYRKKLLNEQEKLQTNKDKARAETLSKYSAILEEKARDESLKAQRELEEETANYRKKKLNESAKEFGKKINEAVPGLSKSLNALGGSVEKYLGTYTQYMTQVNARLQGAGSNLNYETINNKLRTNTALNPYVKYTTVLEKMANLVDQGIASNVVQRAFLASISDKIATTFNAAESSLLQIVRIQQKDSTAARLGMEAELTQLFNHYFSDTSYLSDTFDSVQSALIDISAQLGEQSSIEVEYMVQKWLGALGSVGVNSSTLQTLAQGVNYLGTGDVESLASNAALQNLFVMAANKNGLNYSKMLSEGVNAAEVNTLLGGIVKYIQDIASTSNNVVKKQYAQLFGMTMSDMVAFNNISDDIIKDLYNSAMTYTDTLTELDSQLGQVSGRMHLSEKIDNLFDNILASVGLNVANNQALYGIWKSDDLLQSITGGIELPFISALGTGMDLNMSLEGLAKGGVIGFSTVASLISGLSALNSEGGLLGLQSWQLDAGDKSGFTSYQNARTLTTKKSAVGYVSSGDSLGIQQSLSDSQKDTGKSVSGTEETEADEMIAILKFIKSYFEDGGLDSKPLRVEVSKIDSSALPSTTVSPFYSYTNGGLI